MGACDGRTQGASIAALSRRPRTPQRACPARPGGPCSFCWSFLGERGAERLERRPQPPSLLTVEARVLSVDVRRELPGLVGRPALRLEKQALRVGLVARPTG